MRPAIHQPGAPDFGPNVYVFTPSMPQSQIQATVDSIASQQVGNQFGTQRYALLFEPGTYGSAADPLFFQVGYYTSVAGLGASPGDVVINGAVDSFNQCSASGSCTALVNFWRSLSNLTINFPTPPSGAPCPQTAEFWATSQASPVRRVDVNGFVSLEDYCTRAELLQRRLHRRLAVLRQHRAERHPAAVRRAEQQPRRLDQRRLEPGLLR